LSSVHAGTAAFVSDTATTAGDWTASAVGVASVTGEVSELPQPARIPRPATETALAAKPFIKSLREMLFAIMLSSFLVFS
jgi:hypothetical protein